MTRLRDDEWYAIRTRFTNYLNLFEKDPELKLASDYFYDYEVHADEKWYGLYRFLLISLLTDDDGGPSMLFIHCDIQDVAHIEFASWTFDTTTTVWIENNREKEVAA